MFLQRGTSITIVDRKKRKHQQTNTHTHTNTKTETNTLPQYMIGMGIVKTDTLGSILKLTQNKKKFLPGF